MLRAGEKTALRRLETIAKQVNALEADFEGLSDAELREETEKFKARLADGETLDRLLPEAFAAVREASKRTIGKRHFDVQIMGGAALHQGNVAEMRTGEGKTLVATLPSYLNALTGKGVHVITTNDYLAQYQSELMGRVHRALGLETGCILSSMTPAQRREQYAMDITYGTNNEFGFDYLRDNMAWSLADLVQREHHCAIVDEVDSILIDEARTPLIISGPADAATKWYTEFSKLVRRLERGEAGDALRGIEPWGDYEVDEKKKTVGVLEQGIEKVEDYLGIDNLYESANTPLIGYLNNAIKAKELFTRDKDYIVRSGEVQIVDGFTGRILAGRRYNEGMHQAIEAKEGVEIKNENQTLANVTLQNYFRLYDKLAGMTGTAETEAAELNSIYGLDVVQIPTNRPNQREDHPDVIYKTQEAKFAAVVDDIAEHVDNGQPVLVGTTSVERSEYLSQLLKRRGVDHNVLNAKQHEEEGRVIASAGLPGAVTVATNMAGRGTDIVLGGNPEVLLDHRLKEQGLDPFEDEERYQAAWDEQLPKAKERSQRLGDQVREAGGLYVLGTERHESRRIDNQLRGRSGRQGDPGETRFYLSMRDDLMVRFVGQSMENMMNRLDIPDDVPIESKMVSNSIKGAQAQVENQNFEMRKNVLKYDEVLNEQRKVVYGERLEILKSADIKHNIRAMIDQTISAYVDGATFEGYVEDWDLDKLWSALDTLYGPTISWKELVDGSDYGAPGELSAAQLKDALLTDAHRAYDELESAVSAVGGDKQMRNVERQIILPVIDTKWREHLYEMDYLKEGIGLRAMAQRDPLVEYQKEGGDMFNAMNDSVREETIRQLFSLRKQFAAQDTKPTETGGADVQA